MLVTYWFEFCLRIIEQAYIYEFGANQPFLCFFPFSQISLFWQNIREDRCSNNCSKVSCVINISNISLFGACIASTPNLVIPYFLWLSPIHLWTKMQMLSCFSSVCFDICSLPLPSHLPCYLHEYMIFALKFT